MARTNNLNNFLTDVAGAIKEKKRSNTPILASDFDTEILSIETGGNYQEKSLTVTTNGNYNVIPDTGYDAIEELNLTINVPTNELQTKIVQIASNGNYNIVPDTGYDGFSQATLEVNVPSGSQSGVLLFPNRQSMIQFSTPVLDDLAIVYDTNKTTFGANKVASRLITVTNDITIDGLPERSSFSFTLGTDGDYSLTLTNGTIRTDYVRFYIRDTSRDISYEFRFTRNNNILTLNYIRNTITNQSIYQINTRNDMNVVDLKYTFLLTSDYQENYSWISNLFSISAPSFEGIYKYCEESDSEYLGVITNMTYANIDDTETYATVNEKQYLPLLKNILTTISNKEYIYSSYGFYEENNQIYLVDRRLVSIYDHNTNTSYIGIAANSRTVNSETQYYYKIVTVNAETGEYGSITEVICDMTDRITNNYFKIGNYGDVKLIISGYIDFTNNTMSQDITFYKINNGSTSLSALSLNTYTNLIFGNIKYLDWHRADTQFDLETKSQLLTNVIGFGKHGEVIGDGTFMNNITNLEFSRNWLDGNTNIQSVNVIQSGEQVPNQTLVGRKEIPSNYENIPVEDAIATRTTSESSTISSSDITLITEGLTRTKNITNTQYHEGKQYYIKMWYNTTQESSMDTYIKEIIWVVYNRIDGSLYDFGRYDNAFKPLSGAGDTGTFKFQVELVWYDFINNKLCCCCANPSSWYTNDYATVFLGRFTLTSEGVLNSNPLVVRLNDSDSYHKYGHPLSFGLDIELNQMYFVFVYYTGSTYTYYGFYRVNLTGDATLVVSNSYKNAYMNPNYYNRLCWYKNYTDADTFTNSLIDLSSGTIVVASYPNYGEVLTIAPGKFYFYDSGILKKYDTINHTFVDLINFSSYPSMSACGYEGKRQLYINNNIYDSDTGELIKYFSGISGYYMGIVNDKYRYAAPYGTGYVESSRTASTTLNIVTYYQYYTATTFPISDELFIVTGNSSTNTKLNKNYKYSAKQLTKI